MLENVKKHIFCIFPMTFWLCQKFQSIFCNFKGLSYPFQHIWDTRRVIFSVEKVPQRHHGQEPTQNHHFDISAVLLAWNQGLITGIISNFHNFYHHFMTIFGKYFYGISRALTRGVNSHILPIFSEFFWGAPKFWGLKSTKWLFSKNLLVQRGREKW